jgi:hypothetical protein
MLRDRRRARSRLAVALTEDTIPAAICVARAREPSAFHRGAAREIRGAIARLRAALRPAAVSCGARLALGAHRVGGAPLRARGRRLAGALDGLADEALAHRLAFAVIQTRRARHEAVPAPRRRPGRRARGRGTSGAHVQARPELNASLLLEGEHAARIGPRPQATTTDLGPRPDAAARRPGQG